MVREQADTVKTAIDGLAVGTTIGTILGYLPYIAAALTIVWTCFRIYETKTVQRWLGKLPPDENSKSS